MRTHRFILLLAVCLPATTFAAGDYVWTDHSGQPVVDGQGNCVSAKHHGLSSTRCGAQPEPAPMPETKPAPAPMAAAPTPAPAPVDSDNDGVIDSADQCPGTAANIRVDAMGCDIDRDKDGVENSVDTCPNTPSGARVDSRGCAEKIVVKNLNFASNSAELNNESMAVLDGIAASIRNNPTVKSIKVTGHSDDRGAAEYNKVLSGKRARAVADYLVSKGLDAGMVSSEGIGEAHPIASNNTADGRRENRRVEIDLK